MDSRTEQSFESIFKPSSSLSEVVPYRDGVVTISARSERLKLDFLTEARARPNIDMDKAELVAGRLKLFFDNKQLNAHVAEDMKRKGLENPFWRALGPVGKTALSLAQMLQMSDVIGSTYSEEKAPALLLNPKHMVTYAKVPEGAPTEVAEAAIIQRVHNTWRHEREHLIRMVDPRVRIEDKRIKNYRMAALIGTSGLIGLGSIYFMPDIPTGGDPHLEMAQAARLIATVMFQLQAPQLVADGLWHYLWDKAEKTANLQGKAGQNLSNLFDFQFEKQTKF